MRTMAGVPPLYFINPATVLELDRPKSGLRYRTGTLSGSSPQRVDWGNPLTFPSLQGESPDQIGTNRRRKRGRRRLRHPRHKLSYSVANLP
jgi:hypothetical protein